MQERVAHAPVHELVPARGRPAVALQKRSQQAFITAEHADVDRRELIQRIADFGISEVDQRRRPPLPVGELAEHMAPDHVAVQQAGARRRVTEQVHRRQIFSDLRVEVPRRSVRHSFVVRLTRGRCRARNATKAVQDRGARSCRAADRADTGASARKRLDGAIRTC